MTEEILVIGGTGFIGTHICNRLVQKGFNVTAGSPEKKESKYLDSEVDIELVDITYHGSLNFEDYSIVINLAGLSPLFQPSEVTYQEIHVDGVKNIVEEAERTDLDYLIHMSAYGADPNAETEYLRTKGEGQQSGNLCVPSIPGYGRRRRVRNPSLTSPDATCRGASRQPCLPADQRG